VDGIRVLDANLLVLYAV